VMNITLFQTLFRQTVICDVLLLSQLKTFMFCFELQKTMPMSIVTTLKNTPLSRFVMIFSLL